MCEQTEFYAVMQGEEATALYGRDWDYGRLDQETAKRKAKRLAGESCQPVWLVKATPVDAD